MAPIAFATDPSSAPLANYFFIAGIESSRITDRKANGALSGQLLNYTIEEDGLSGLAQDISSISVGAAPEGGRRRKRFSYETRKSVGSITGIEAQITTSNRSSATIRPQDQATLASSSDRVFDEAMQIFASERESFLEEIRFSAGQVAQPNKPVARTKTQRVTSDEQRGGKNGSLRRRMSNMSSLSRHPTTSKSKSTFFHLFYAKTLPCRFSKKLSPPQWLQFSHPCSSAIPDRFADAPLEAAIRTRSARPIPHEEHERGA